MTNVAEHQPEAIFPRSEWRRKFRVSLRSLIIGMVLLCMAGSHLRTSWLLNQANQTLKRYRSEFGYLSITDPGKIHAIAVETHHELAWQWRVYLPQGKKYELCSISERIPQVHNPRRDPRLQFPKDRSSHYPIEGQEVLITISIDRDGQDRWRFHRIVQDDNGQRNEMSWGIHDRNMDPIISDGLQKSARGVLAGYSQQEFDPDQNVLLRKIQVYPTGADPFVDQTAGLMFWISPQGN